MPRLCPGTSMEPVDARTLYHPALPPPTTASLILPHDVSASNISNPRRKWRTIAGFRLSNRTPRHRDQDPALHRLNQWHRLVNRISPALNTPRLLSSQLPLLQIRKLPEMVHRVQVSDLYKPCSNSLHHFSSCLEAFSPMRFPFE
jgi:hypothetical protein